MTLQAVTVLPEPPDDPARPWETVGRPGYWGSQRDNKMAALNKAHGEGNWRLVWRNWMTLGDQEAGFLYPFVDACKAFYEESYYVYLKDRPYLVDEICSYGECIDNDPSNVESGLDYAKQGMTRSTHIQDIAVRNVLHRLGRSFTGTGILVIRTSSDNGHKFGPGNIPFYAPTLIAAPSLRPKWANEDSVEDFWQSNKYLQVR